jgi:hypothetical protein
MAGDRVVLEIRYSTVRESENNIESIEVEVRSGDHEHFMEAAELDSNFEINVLN